ncbi:MFS transporter [Actinoplanes regularis]|nr:MFS transporter [Actinoplanes regularis]
MPSTFVGTVLTTSGIIAICVGAPIGRLIDRVPVARANIVVLVAQATSVAALAFIQGPIPFALAAGLVALTGKVKLAARGALIALAFAGTDRVRTRSWLRSLSNLGMAGGSAIAAIATGVDKPWLYRLALLLVSATYLVSAGLLRPLRTVTASPRADAGAGGRRGALRDRVYLTIALLNGLLGVHYLLIEVGVPVWAQNGPLRALWLVSAGLIINTVVVVLGQVPLTARLSGVSSAIRAQILAGGLFVAFGAMLLIAGHLRGVPQAVWACGAFTVYSLGEVLQAAAAWELSFELADPNRPGEYQGAFASGAALGPALAPLVITGALNAIGDVGLLALGVGLLVLALLQGPIVSRVQPC